jgi:hypothetical protein
MVEDFKMENELHLLGIGSRECEKEYHCKLHTKQDVAAHVRKVLKILKKT